jgi:gremlin
MTTSRVKQFALIFLMFHIIECHRIHLSDSIMDIINTQHVEKILADRRQQQQQASNNLDGDAATETDADIFPTSDTLIDFDYNTNQPHRSRAPLPIQGEVVMKYNDSVIPSTRYPNGNVNLLSDMQAYKGDKILKSSKNALFIARKELLKQDWCKTEPFEMKIREDGCYSKRITNNFCYGQCNSFYIPKMPKRRRKNHRNMKQMQHRGDHHQRSQQNNVDSFRSCSYCKPKEFSFVTIVLKCPSLTPNYRRKRIQIVKECRCISQNTSN